MTHPNTKDLAPRLLVIANPTAGRGRRRRVLVAVIDRLQQRGCRVTLRWTTQRGDAEKFAAAARRAEFDRVVAAGGDGTINEAMNGLIGAADALPLAIIPTGTANVLAAEIGLGRSVDEIAAAIVSGPSRRVHLGRVERATGARRFAMMAGVGFDARVVARVDPRLKRLFGKGAYVLAALAQLMDRADRTYDVVVDGVSYRAASVIVANGRYYAGRFIVARAARLDDEALHVCLFGRPGRWNVIRYAVALALGRLDRLSDVTILRARRVEVAGSAAEPVQIDGDRDGGLPAIIESESIGLSLTMPAASVSRERGTFAPA